MNEATRTALELAKVALYHSAPADCWATGPLTGDMYEDLVVCPGCKAIKVIDALLSPAASITKEVSP